MQGMADAIEGGKYRTKGTPRANDDPARAGEPAKSSPSEDNRRAEPPEKKPEKLDHKAFTDGISSRRVEAVEKGVRGALDERFKGKK